MKNNMLPFPSRLLTLNRFAHYIKSQFAWAATIVLFMALPSTNLKAQGCNTSATVVETCTGSALLTSLQTSGWTYTWYSCDASGNSANLLSSTPSNTYTVYPASSTGNQTDYYKYIGDDGNSNVCVSGVITVKYDYDLEIADVSGTYTVQPYSTTITYSSYQWYLNGNAITTGGNGSTYTPAQSGIYTVTATASCGGTRTSNSLTYFAPNIQCSTSTASYSTCSNTYTLSHTPSAGYSVDWYECDQYGANGSFLNSGTNITVSLSSTIGTVGQYRYYYYICTDNFYSATCTSAVITVRFDLNLNIQSNNGSSVPATLTANSSGQTYTNYQWFRNGQAIMGATTNTYNISLAGDYFIVCTSSCGGSLSNTISIGCGLSNNYSNYTFTGSTTFSYNTIVLDGTIIIDGDATLNLNNCDVFMTSGSEIIVKKRGSGQASGGTFQILNTKISSCGKWGGIYAEGWSNTEARTDSSAHVSISYSEIHDAYIGLFADNNARLNIDHSLFENNYRHIDLRYFGGTKNYGCDGGAGWDGNRMDYTYNTFNFLMETAPSFTPTNFPSTPKNNSYRKQIYIDYGRAIKLSNSTFNCYNWSAQDQNAVEVYTSYWDICHWDAFEITNCTFNGDYNDAIMFTDAYKISIVSNTIYGAVNHGIEVFDGDQVYIQYNIIHHNSSSYGGISGANISQVNNFSFVNNDVHRFTKGLEYYNLTNHCTGIINKNTFDSCKYGLVIAPECDPTASSLACTNSTNYTNWRDLNLSCNRVYYCEWGIVGVGHLIQQGNSGWEWETFFGNNSKADIAWYRTGGQNLIYNDNINHALQWACCTLSLDGHNITAANIGNYIYEQFGTTPANPCRGTWKTDPVMPPQANIVLQTNTINVFPNPTTDYLVLENNYDAAMGFILLDMTGKQVLWGNVKAKSRPQFDISNLQVGCYLLRLYNYTDGKSMSSQKIIKTNPQ